MKKKLLLMIVFIISFLLTSCNVYSHTHNYQDGQCGCGEKDPEYIHTHIHEYKEGICECGEKDPEYVPPHIHEYSEGICECGEKDPEYVPPHIHEYNEGICECGEWMPNYGETLTIEFQADDESYLIEIDSGDKITRDLLFMETNEESVVLYYDKDFLIRYYFEPIYYDTVLYIKWIDKDDLRDMARETFYDFYVLVHTNTLLDEIIIREDYGIYGDCFVGIIQEENSVYFDDITARVIIEDLVFEYSNGYEVFAYHNGKIYGLETTENIVVLYDIL